MLRVTGGATSQQPLAISSGQNRRALDNFMILPLLLEGKLPKLLLEMKRSKLSNALIESRGKNRITKINSL